MNLFPNKIKTQLLPETEKPFQATKNSTTLARKIAQSWSLIHLVVIVSELLLKISNSK